MPNYDQILKIKEDAESRLRSFPGVHAVGIGKKSVGGKFTNELAITVFVTEKKPLDQLNPADVIPAEIDGVKTDVVQVPKPELIMAGNPSYLTATISANKLSVTFAGKNPEQGGLLVVLEFDVVQGTASPTHYVSSYEPASWETLNEIATALAKKIKEKAITGLTAAAAGAQVTITAAAGTTGTFTHCDVTAVDDTRYFEDHIRGGIQIQAGGREQGIGTIAFLATTAVTPQDPHGKVVAVTCQHVVCFPSDQTTNLVATVSGNKITFSKNNSKAIPLESLVEIKIDSPAASFFYNTVAGDLPIGIAAAVITAVTHAAIAGVTAASGGPGIVTFTLPPGATLSCKTYGPPTVDQDADLTATVVGNQVTFTGEVGGDDYGIFTSADAGGLNASAGVFTHPKKGDTLSSVATGVAQAFAQLPAFIRGSITATATANSVRFDHAETAMCVIKSDIEVGQPDNSFGSPCSHCCSHRIGRVIDSRIDVDVAIVQLDAGQKWVPEIEGFGLVTGTHDVLPGELPLNVLKRGRTLPHSILGSIQSVNVSGDIGERTAFQRRYVNAMLIKSLESNNAPFALPGDSGSAVVDFGGSVAGVLFGAGNIWGWATPIDPIMVDAFASLQLDLAPAPEAGHAPGDIRTVPASAMSAVTEEQQATAAALRPFLQKRLAQVERDVSATPDGLEYAELVKRHFAETQRLINGNRRVATAWHRNGGPQILQAFLNMLQRRDQRLPVAINGKPFADCVERMRRVFARYASPALAKDLSRFAPRLETFAGLSYSQILASLRPQTGD